MKILVVCLAVFSSVALLTAEEKPEKPVRTYTNEDLIRVSPHRGETGGTSAVVVAPGAPSSPPAADPHRKEAYWRREAQHVQEQLRTLRHKAAELELQIADARRAAGGSGASGRGRGGSRSGGSRGSSAPGGSRRSVESLEARLRLLQSEIRERESAFEDRARREGALPGWLR